MLSEGVNYLEKAEKLQEQANKVIEDLQMRRRWAAVGHTVLVGSANFGLMTTPNLDFEIYVEHPDIRKGFDILREIAVVPGVKRIQSGNFMDTDDPGLYWCIHFEDQKGIIWDIDNWIVPFDHPHAGMAENFAEAMKRVLTNENRQIILKIKSQMSSEKGFRGIDIYKAVLSGGVSDREQFQKWIEKNPPAKMETWKPIV